MSQDKRSRAQTATRTRPQSLPSRKSKVESPKSKIRNPQSAIRSPIEGYRLTAALILALLLAFSLIVTRPPSAPDLTTLVTPNIDGSGSVPPGMTSEEVARSVFRYTSIVERNQNSQVLENVADVLRFDPGSQRVRQILVGQIYTSSTGGLSQTLVDTGFFTHRERLADLESSYEAFLGNEEQAPRGLNGLAAMALARALDAKGDDRKELERNAILGFQGAISNSAQPTSWQFIYNWSLANMYMGNYASAYEGMKNVVTAASNDNNHLAPFWMGIAALRLGDPGAALESFTQAINANVPEGSADKVQDAYTLAKKLSDESLKAHDSYMLAKKLSNEGLADAQWANRDPDAAYATYYRLLLTYSQTKEQADKDLADALRAVPGNQSPDEQGLNAAYNRVLSNKDYTGLYPKWIRLGIQQRAYERLANDIQGLETKEGFRDDPRMHHDRARLLTFLGRTAEAETEYKEAIRLGQDDASLLISYGQALESQGDHNDALVQAETALRSLGKDPASSDLSSVASAAVLTTTSTLDKYNAQQVMDAYLLRAHAWGKLGQANDVLALVNGITQQAGSLSSSEANLLSLYAGYAAEAGGLANDAANSYKAAWDKLKNLPPGTLGRVAALTGLARASASAGNANAGLQALKDGGYDSTALKSSVVSDPDAPDILYQGGLLLKGMGRNAEAANTLRVAAIADNLQTVRQVTGSGRPIWYSNGTFTPSNAVLQAAEASRDVGESQRGLTILRYRESFLLDPAQASAWNNLGVLYAQAGKKDLAGFYLSAAGTVSPDYALGRHNQAALEYQRGIGNFFSAEEAQGAAIKSAGAQSLSWGYNLRTDDRGPFPAPIAPTQDIPDLLMRLAALVILALLLAHTLVGNDRIAKGMSLQPTRGVIGRFAVSVDEAARKIFPALMRPGSSIGALLLAIIIPSIIGMVGLAWLSGHGSAEVMLVLLPVALLVALLAFGANELAQYVVARRTRGVTLHHVWPMGVLLGILSIPFGFVYGWQVVTRVQPATAETEDEESASLHRGAIGRHARTGEDLDLAYEARLEAAAELGPSQAGAKVGVAAVSTPASNALFGLTPAARILFAGLVANLLLGLLFGIAYWLTAWPSMRLGMFASMLVLAFTSVSEPPADGWTLYRRNPLLWLGIFVLSAVVVTLLATSII